MADEKNYQNVGISEVELAEQCEKHKGECDECPLGDLGMGCGVSYSTEEDNE